MVNKEGDEIWGKLNDGVDETGERSKWRERGFRILEGAGV